MYCVVAYSCMRCAKSRRSTLHTNFTEYSMSFLWVVLSCTIFVCIFVYQLKVEECFGQFLGFNVFAQEEKNVG